jgi:L-malate glycosyltransferase
MKPRTEKNGPAKILYIIWSLDLGGAEQVVMNLAMHLNRKRFEPIVCCLNGKGRYAEKVEQAGIKVIALDKAPKLDPTLLFRLISLIKREKVDLIHTHLFTSNLWGRLAAKFSGVPVVSTEHNVDVWKNKFHFAVDRFLLPVNARIIFVSKKVKEFYEERLGRMNGVAQVFYNGIEVDKFSAASRNPLLKKELGINTANEVIAVVGRLVPAKAMDLFLEAFASLQKNRKNVSALIVGDGPLRSELEAKAVQLQIRDSVVFSGFRKDLPEIYRIMDVFVLSSLREGFPMTLLEAMASEVPSVTTDVGGVGECIENGVDGFLVPTQDVQALARSIEKILADPALRQSFVEKAKKKVCSKFSVQHMVDEHEKLYEEVLIGGVYARAQ